MSNLDLFVETVKLFDEIQQLQTNKASGGKEREKRIFAETITSGCAIIDSEGRNWSKQKYIDSSSENIYIWENSWKVTYIIWEIVDE